MVAAGLSTSVMGFLLYLAVHDLGQLLLAVGDIIDLHLVMFSHAVSDLGQLLLACLCGLVDLYPEFQV